MYGGAASKLYAWQSCEYLPIRALAYVPHIIPVNQIAIHRLFNYILQDPSVVTATRKPIGSLDTVEEAGDISVGASQDLSPLSKFYELS